MVSNLRKKVISICVSLIILAAFIYSIATNLLAPDARQKAALAKVESDNLSAIEQEQIFLEDDEMVSNEEGGLEYRYIDEPEEDFHVEEGHNHEHEELQETEVKTMNVQAPNFELKTLTGERMKLSDLKGKKVFINFWATWCPPCIEEMPTIQHFYEEHANDENFVILSVNATDLESDIDSVKQFAKNHKINFPILLDEKGDVSITYEILTIPTSIIINEEGIVVEQIIGPVSEEMLVSKLLNE